MNGVHPTIEEESHFLDKRADLCPLASVETNSLEDFLKAYVYKAFVTKARFPFSIAIDYGLNRRRAETQTPPRPNVWLRESILLQLHKRSSRRASAGLRCGRPRDHGPDVRAMF